MLISPKTGKLFILTAPSGGGKTTLLNASLKLLQESYPIQKVVTYTTRPPRANEIEGKDYFFLSKEDFLTKKEQGFFIETTTYDNNFYGSAASIITDLKAGTSFMIATDRPGAQILKDLIPNAILIWIEVKDINVLRERLQKRYVQSPELLKERLDLAVREIEQEKTTPLCRYHVMNDDLPKAIHDLIDVIKKELDSR